MKTANQRGFVITALGMAVAVIAGLVLLFVQNPISSSLGVGVRPNKVVQVQTQTVEPIRDAQGNPVAYKTTTNSSDQDIQQHVTFLEWLRSLPILVLVLMGLGVIFPPVALFIHNLWAGLRGDAKKIVTGMDKAFATVALTLAGKNLPGEVDRAALAKDIVDAMKNELGYHYDDSTKQFVRSVRGA